MWTRKRLRMSWWNALMTFVLLVVAAALTVAGQWFPAVASLVAAVAIAATAVYARSGRASDVTRLNALEVVDERDRSMTAFALAVVGVAGLLFSMATFLAATALLEPSHPMFWVAWGQVLGMTAVWIVANLVAVRRI
ncbi:hypothetical protein GCM10028784_01760 [Myceligenerans cantabricum]